ncbi:GntP family permease [Sporomusa acidovorans]|uniref:Inner membrane permease YgbN n=1 Tax=Sporomusa acidovorans (strain ATCC 49682 / DSM 3132 / Mol) TaxID=1123286 RepID=A0ABZ3IXM8_SPOA4|nr:GntP family permease [Sporomusa acidovorans]OZC22225.1 inner membrane permease YgbN [Sporomusa acidovorans DSM 3132]SDE81257.1 gluconate:H+ symporter, GntP family [Sporomusa acidovorans]
MGSIIALILGIAVLLWMIIKTKIQAFPALIFTSILVGLLAGLPTAETMKAVSGGFGGTLGSIGIVIGFGCIMGKFLEKSGAAKKMALTILRMVGVKNADVALGLSGLLVGIPVFCDSGFVILSELAKEFSRITKRSMVGLGGILGMGLYITHFLVPPTPGPLAVAGFFKVDLGIMILCGILLSIPIFLISLAYFRHVEKRFPALIPERTLDDLSINGEQKQTLENILAKHKSMEELTGEDFKEIAATEQLPGTLLSFSPIVVPVLLILANTIAGALKVGGVAGSVIGILGNPIVAVFIAVLLSVYGLCATLTREEAQKIMESSLADAGLIILVTGAGGALGNVIRVTNIGDTIAHGIIALSIPVILVPLLLGALLRIPQGSGTVAMITGGSILAPMLPTLGLEPVIAALCLCSTAMFISYPNDSYFWVVTRFSGMDVKTSLKSWSIGTAIIPVSASIILIIVNAFL